MENQDFLQFGTANSSLPISGQQQDNLFSSDLLQPPDTRSNHSGSFSNQIEAGIADVEIKPVEYDRYLYDSVFKATSELVTHTTSSEIPTSSDYSDPLTGDVTPVNNQAILDLAVTNANEQLELFASDAEFLEKMNLAFGENWQPQEAEAFIQDLVSGETIPKFEVLPGADLRADGAFGEGTIYLSEKFLSENAANPEAVAGVLLEEIGHYVDQELSNVDSPGDEGDIFARLAQGETIAGAELTALKTEDDSTTLALYGKEIAVELAAASEPAPLEPVSIPAIENEAASTTPPYPGYNLAYDPNAPEYNEDTAVVQLWQQRMLDLGYEITVDGSYGEQSKAVAIAFQQAQGLAADGIVGPDTWEASFNASASEPAPLEPVSIPAIENQAASTTPTGTQSPISGDIDPQPSFGDLNIWRYDTGGRSEPGIIEPGKETVLIIHGWDSSDQSRQIEELAKEVSEDDVQVLALDWSGIAAAGLDDFPPPYNTAGWITPVAEWTQDRLEDLQIDPSQLTLVGHSLGSYVSSEIARDFGRVKNLVALDPAFPGINSLLSGYDVDRDEPGQQLPANFSDVATNSLAFVADNSNFFTDDISEITSAKGGVSGDSDKAASAHDSFVIQFPSGTNDAHSLVVDVFTDALDKGHLELLDLALPNHEDNWYSDNGNKLNEVASKLPDSINGLLDLNHHEGRISATSTGEVEVLTRVVDSSGTEEPAWT